ncbi:MAG: Crp/Fnr family transcriptional regulator [Campylobacter sp.]|nr:Crp/Fnr family transcriptional regulator [Campylobacter sp.]MBQ7271904.1 Crp/Fnr family transcriptional regulator [Campylobacter sp.]MBQ9875852.1 Crp/Fnr family transcriptional regulator [Campylobacter sp.]MBR0071616.1 Crp/Fnr family transcriptional regulator [Campylobacter sp.]
MNLKEIPFFKNLSEKELKRLKEISFFKSYKKGEILFYEGEESENLLILVQGVVKIYKMSSKNKEILLHLIRPISIVAELVNFDEIPYPASCEFITDGEVLKINYAKFKTEFMENPKICVEIIKSLTEKIRALNLLIERQVVLNADERVVNFIMENFELFKNSKQSQIANLLNLAPETLSRMINKFKKSGFLVFDDNGKVVKFDETKV